MRDNSKNLFTLSIIVLVVTALAFLTNTFIIILLLESLKDLKVEGNVDQNQVRAILKTVFIIAYVVESLINSGEVFLGVQGIRQSNGKDVGKAHIVISIVLMVLQGLGVLGVLYNMITSFSPIYILSLIMSVGMMVLLFFYHKFANDLYYEFDY